jgi:hypothetical protein
VNKDFGWDGRSVLDRLIKDDRVASAAATSTESRKSYSTSCGRIDDKKYDKLLQVRWNPFTASGDRLLLPSICAIDGDEGMISIREQMACTVSVADELQQAQTCASGEGSKAALYMYESTKLLSWLQWHMELNSAAHRCCRKLLFDGRIMQT